MKILWYNSTPLAGMPWRTAKVMDRFLRPQGGWARCLTQKAGYGGGRVFPTDLTPNTPEAHQAAQEADLAIVGAYFKGSIPGNPDLPYVRHYSTEHFRWADPSPEPGSATVVGQYQHSVCAPQLDPLPNCMPIDDPMFMPEPKPQDRVRIVYAPSSRMGEDVSGPRGWARKSYAPVTKALEHIGLRSERNEYPLPVEIFVLENVPYEEVMAAKRTAHICIDECSTGSYHSSGLEGLACGCATLCWLSSNVQETLRTMLADGAMEEGVPFELSTKSKIESALETLVSNPGILEARGRWARNWMETWYSEAWQASTWIGWHQRYLERCAANSSRT